MFGHLGRVDGAAKQFRHLLNDPQHFLPFIPLRTVDRLFDVIEEFIQFIEYELRGRCRRALGRQLFRQMRRQLGIFEDGLALSLREIQLHALVPFFRMTTRGEVACWSVDAPSPPILPHRDTAAGYRLPAL